MLATHFAQGYIPIHQRSTTLKISLYFMLPEQQIDNNLMHINIKYIHEYNLAFYCSVVSIVAVIVHRIQSVYLCSRK